MVNRMRTRWWNLVARLSRRWCSHDYSWTGDGLGWWRCDVCGAQVKSQDLEWE